MFDIFYLNVRRQPGRSHGRGGELGSPPCPSEYSAGRGTRGDVWWVPRTARRQLNAMRAMCSIRSAQSYSRLWDRGAPGLHQPERGYAPTELTCPGRAVDDDRVNFVNRSLPLQKLRSQGRPWSRSVNYGRAGDRLLRIDDDEAVAGFAGRGQSVCSSPKNRGQAPMCRNPLLPLTPRRGVGRRPQAV
jgi:hypothetical protein